MTFACLQLSVLFHPLIDEEITERPSWSWSYGSWIYYYLCNQCQSPLTLWVISITTYILLEQSMHIYEGIPVTIKQMIEQMKRKSMGFFGVFCLFYIFIFVSFCFLFLAFVCLFGFILLTIFM